MRNGRCILICRITNLHLILPLSLLHQLCPRTRSLPKPTEISREKINDRWVQAIIAIWPIAADLHNTGFTEKRQMIREAGLRKRQRLSQLPGGAILALSQQRNDMKPRRIR